MSRIGKKPIVIPEKMKVNYKNGILELSANKGVLRREIHSDVELVVDNEKIMVVAPNDSKKGSALQGLVRALIANMVTGVTKGFERGLEINGIGYKVELKNESLILTLGYSNPIKFDLPNGVSASIEKNKIKLMAIDKELLGHTAASIRRLRPPEPYKLKGIKYIEEIIQKKAGKTGSK
ncbi:MAG: 50S ribosomal protein L6 [Desulfobacterales bacterium]|nr:50S ribosomal protein L6 [Desulfobacterales bacterium]